MKAIRTALINIRRMPYKSLLAVVIISLTCFIGYSFSLLILGSEQILHYFESKPKVIAFFKIKAQPSELQIVGQEMQSKAYVQSLSIDDKQEALDYYQQYQQNPLLLELVSADILPASLEVSATAPDYLSQIKQDLQTYDSIDEVVLYQEVVENLNHWTRSLRLIGLVLTSVLGVVCVLIVATIVSLKISHKKRSISILRIIGATSGYIITPFIYEGFIYGLLGAALGWAGMYVGLLYLTPWLKSFVGQIISLPLDWEFLALQFGIGALVAVFFGGFASILAAKKLIRK